MSDIAIDVGYDRGGYWVRVDVLIEDTGFYLYTFDTGDRCQEFYGFVVDSYHLLTDRLPDQPEDRLRLFETGLERAYEALTGEPEPVVPEPEYCRCNHSPYGVRWSWAEGAIICRTCDLPRSPVLPKAPAPASVYGRPYTGPVAPDKPDRAIPVAAGVYVVPPGPPLTGRWNPDAGKPVNREFCWVCEETHPVGSYPHKEDR